MKMDISKAFGLVGPKSKDWVGDFKKVEKIERVLRKYWKWKDVIVWGASDIKSRAKDIGKTITLSKAGKTISLSKADEILYEVIHNHMVLIGI